MHITFTARLWLYDGPAAWCFATVPPEQSDELKAVAGLAANGWGMIPVRVRVGQTEWDTSVFPSKGVGYVLPVTAAVRKKEGLQVGDEVSLWLEVR